MTNRSSSKQHGLVGNQRPKAKLRKRRNKVLANQRKAALRQVVEVRLGQAKKTAPAKIKNEASKEEKKMETSS